MNQPAQDEVQGLIEQLDPEARTRQLGGLWRPVASGLCLLLACYALYWTQFTVTAQVYRAVFLLGTLVLCFLYYPIGGRVGAWQSAGLFVLSVCGFGSYLADEGLTPLDRPVLIVLGAGAVFAAIGARRLRKPGGVTAGDLLLALLSVVSLVYLVTHYEDALQRVTLPNGTEILLGLVLIYVIFEATRRTSGWALPLTTIFTLLYGYFGPYMPEPFDHRGYGVARIVGQNYLTLEGIFGVPLDVAASFIVLFTIYGAMLEYSGAGRFFLDWSFAAMGKSRNAAGAGRTVTLAGFLFGTVSGSGVATTVTLGTLAWPLLKKAGYDKDTAGGILASAGIGATLSPPTLGAAAFLIAEYLRISYLDVLIMASVPTVLYYASCFFMIEAEAKRQGAHAVEAEAQSLWYLTTRYGYHFSSLFVVAILMAVGLTVFMAVFWATALAFALSFIRSETRLCSARAALAGAAVALVLAVTKQMPTTANALFVGFGVTVAWCIVSAVCFRSAADRRLLDALESGGKGALSVTATTATAGILVSIVTLTGLGLKLSGLIVDLAHGVPFLTVAFAAIAVLVLGLAVPVTASYIISAVMVVPALTQAGVSEAAAHMFVFYYAVLSDVSPPTALSPFAAAAITGGNPLRTTMQTWKFCLPAFVVPFLFTLSEPGRGLLLLADVYTDVWVSVAGLCGVIALAVVVSGVAKGRLGIGERLGFGAAAALLFVPRLPAAAFGLALAGLTFGAHAYRLRQVVSDGNLRKK